jgi:hypothetical protein
MKTSTLFTTASALAMLFAFPAHADEADGSDRALAFTSSRSVADVKAEAAMPVRISNGGTGFIGVMNSGLTRESVSAQAAAAVKNGRISKGEIGVM